jgi:AbrB family looped-hinge helix DNA binding protein
MVHEIYDRGQIVIPKYIRELLGWKKGTKLNFKIEDEKVILENTENKTDQFMEEWDELKIELNIGASKLDDYFKNEKKYRKKYLQKDIRGK